MSELEDETGDTGFDLGASLDTIASDIGLKGGEPVATPEPEGQEPVDTTAAPKETDVTVLEPPKSWSKDKHELWKTLPRDAQDYYTVREKQMLDGIEQYKGDAGYAKQLRDVITPYVPMLRSQGISETDAIHYLFNAHNALTNGTPEQRRAAYQQLGNDLGFGEQQQENVDPAVKNLSEQVRELRLQRDNEERAKQQEVRTKANAETNSFASDPANAYFNEVAKDMVPFVRDGSTLKDAYDKAVWANPVTRAKEMARLQTEEAAKLKATAKTEGETARRAKGVNVNSAETRRAPTEPKGKFLDDSDMRDTLKSIRDRAH